MQNLDELLSSINDAVWSVDVLRNKFLYVNQRLADICETPLSEIEKGPQVWLSFIHPDDKKRVNAELSTIEKTLKVEVEHRIIAATTIKWVLTKQILLCDVNGNSEIMVGIVTDITEKKTAELKLIESERTYRYVFQNNPNPLWIYDRKTLRFLRVNDAAIENYGYTEKEFLSMTIADIRPIEDLPKLLQKVRSVKNRYKGSRIWRHQKKDGSVIWASVSGHGFDYHGRASEIVLSVDVTEELKIKQEILNKNTRLMEIASLASHEIRGPLMSILGLTNIFNKEKPEDPFNVQVLEHLQQAVNQLDDVVHRIVDKTFKVESIETVVATDAFQQNQ